MSAFARRALLSVTDKSQLDVFAGALVELGFEIVSTGGTQRYLLERGLPVTEISEYTGFPEMMDGRLKTLHPRVHGGLLGRLDHAADVEAMRAHGILPFEIVCCNLYAFEATVAKPGATLEDAIENIDIGGPSMIRSAAKNHARLAVVTSPSQYQEVIDALRKDGLSLELRRRLAAAAYATTARYDAAIAAYLTRVTQPDETAASWFPQTLHITLQQRQALRYGENPHQQGAFYVESPAPAGSIAAATQRHGKELSYNNLLDLDAALALVRRFDRPAAVVLKHNNPCGAGVADSLAEAFERAYEGDPISAFGGIVGFNQEVDLATAEKLCVPNRFLEAIVAPRFTNEAFEALTTRPKWKANVRLLETGTMSPVSQTSLEYRRVSGGLLVQETDDLPDPEADWKVMTKRAPTPAEWADLKFAWLVVAQVKSNAIVVASGDMLLGVGAGQMSRVDSVNIAVSKAGAGRSGLVLASDAFFPFRDGVDAAAEAGVQAFIQPGGSRNDADAVAACDERGLTMVFTGRRHFKH